MLRRDAHLGGLLQGQHYLSLLGDQLQGLLGASVHALAAADAHFDGYRSPVVRHAYRRRGAALLTLAASGSRAAPGLPGVTRGSEDEAYHAPVVAGLVDYFMRSLMPINILASSTFSLAA